ncbi:hypothetical protein AZ66_01745 [Paenibacillus sp. E194]|nr:hypothetical protein AZ66_01745 [Paenibacillus sp. E194]
MTLSIMGVMTLLLFYASLTIGVIILISKRANNPNRKLALLTLTITCAILVNELISKFLYGQQINLITIFFLIILAASCSTQFRKKN